MNKNNRHKQYKKQQAAKKAAKKNAYVERKFNTMNEEKFQKKLAKNPNARQMTLYDVQDQNPDFMDMSPQDKVKEIKVASDVFYSSVSRAQFDRFSETFWNDELINSSLRQMIDGNNLAAFLQEIQQTHDSARTIQFYFALNRAVRAYYGDKKSIDDFMSKQVYRYVA